MFSLDDLISRINGAGVLNKTTEPAKNGWGTVTTSGTGAAGSGQFKKWKSNLAAGLKNAGKQMNVDSSSRSSQGGFSPAPPRGPGPSAPVQQMRMPTPMPPPQSSQVFGSPQGQMTASFGNAPQQPQYDPRRRGAFRFGR